MRRTGAGIVSIVLKPLRDGADAGGLVRRRLSGDPELDVAQTDVGDVGAVEHIPCFLAQPRRSFQIRERVADLDVERDQEGTSMTFVYISSQSPTLSFGANTGQFSGKGR